MTPDVDEEGWSYSFSFSPVFAWHGNHVWFHSFVRRRRWLRKRVKIPPQNSSSTSARGITDFDSSCEGSVERAGHRLNSDYFTIHSRGSAGVNAKKKRSVLEGNDWGGVSDESDEETEITDIGTLMSVAKKARLDREKIEAVVQFVAAADDDIVYLPEKVSWR
jgi:hypothetical protein